MLIEYTPTKSQIEYAYNRARDYKNNPKAKIVMAKSDDKTIEHMMVGGFLFEAIVRDHYGIELTGENGEPHDIVIEGKRVELKSTIVRYKPHEDYHIQKRANQRTDATHFIFGCVMHDFTKVWLAGWLQAPEFLNQKRFRRVGEIQRDGFCYKFDCYDVKLKELRKLRAPKSP